MQSVLLSKKGKEKNNTESLSFFFFFFYRRKTVTLNHWTLLKYARQNLLPFFRPHFGMSNQIQQTRYIFEVKNSTRSETREKVALCQAGFLQCRTGEKYKCISYISVQDKWRYGTRWCRTEVSLNGLPLLQARFSSQTEAHSFPTYASLLFVEASPVLGRFGSGGWQTGSAGGDGLSGGAQAKAARSRWE